MNVPEIFHLNARSARLTVSLLIIVAAIAVITSVGGKVLARWTSLNSSI